MIDTTKISDIRIGITVKINLQNKPNAFSVGKIYEIISKNDDIAGIVVSLENGDIGNVIEVINSPEIIKERILATEAHDSENKLNFYERVMKEKSIPLTIQSFLNSDGGYLYIGVYDNGNTPKEKLVSLNEDRKIVENALIKSQKLKPGEKISDGKFMDIFRSDIEKTLDKFLVADIQIGSLIDFNFPIIDGAMILEINVKRSPVPFFYKYWSRNNKEINFGIYNNDEKNWR